MHLASVIHSNPTLGLQAAGAIHSDFERGFICAEVMHYDELVELGSENAVKAAGKYRQEVRTVYTCLGCPVWAILLSYWCAEHCALSADMFGHAWICRAIGCL